MKRRQKILKYIKKHVLSRKHSKRGELFKLIKRPLHKDEKVEARFSLD